MRQPQELIEHTQLMHQLQGGRMDGVAAKIAEEITVLFKHDHFNTGAGKKQTEHHAGGTAAGDTTSGSDLSRVMRRLTHEEKSTDKYHSTASSRLISDS